MKNAKTHVLWILLTICSVFFYSCTGDTQTSSQQTYAAPNAPVDKPVSPGINLEQVIKPYIAKAKQTYPEAKQRFLKGLPVNHSFFITTRLQDNTGNIEQVFIAVSEIKNSIIKGVIWNDLQAVSGYKKGDKYRFPESKLLDWTITKPNGTEEGNFVGKFLDDYQSQKR